MTLTDFLLARIAEDEGDACEAKDDYFSVDGGLRYGEVGYETLPDLTIDPDRLLAECEAKRRIIALHDGGKDRSRGRWINQTGCACGDLPPCRTLAYLALPYADHPDYREEWRP